MSQDIYRYFSRKECLKGRDVTDPLTPEMEANLVKLLTAVNQLREAYGKPLNISSLYRPASVNSAVGGAKKSSHMTCEAVDFVDVGNREFTKFCLANIPLLEKLGLYMESPDSTPTWLHLQTRPTKNRVFKP